MDVVTSWKAVRRRHQEIGQGARYTEAWCITSTTVLVLTWTRQEIAAGHDSKQMGKVNHVPVSKMCLVFLMGSKTSRKSRCPINRNADLKSESANQRPVWYSENHTYEVHGDKWQPGSWTAGLRAATWPEIWRSFCIFSYLQRHKCVPNCDKEESIFIMDCYFIAVAANNFALRAFSRANPTRSRRKQDERRRRRSLSKRAFPEWQCVRLASDWFAWRMWWEVFNCRSDGAFRHLV